MIASQPRPDQEPRCPRASGAQARYDGAMMLIAIAGAAFLLSYLLTRGLARPGSRLYLLDHPNERSLHDRPVPRGGGLAIVIAAAAGAAAIIGLRGAPAGIGWQGMAWVAAGALVVAAVSFADDRRGLHPALRIGVHGLAALALLAGGLGLEALVLPGLAVALPGWLGGLLAVLFTVWLVNLYNFMDGMDGFAGGMAVFGFGAFALLAGLGGHAGLAASSLMVAAAAGGFLALNFPPARIFMGDVGSSFLGYLAAAFALWADRERAFPLWVAVLVFSPFVVDATVTLLHRLVRGERVWQAHKTHFYQRLVQLGWGHRETVIREYALMGACALSALAASRSAAGPQWAILLVWVGIYGMIGLSIRRLELRGRVTGGR